MDKIILVVYVNTYKLKDKNKIKKYLRKLSESLRNDYTIHYIIPTKSETHIECLNPQLVSKEEYKKTEEFLKKAEKSLNEFLESNSNKKRRRWI